MEYAGDTMGDMERAWIVLGGGWSTSRIVTDARLVLVEDERPALLIPATLPACCRDMVFGWALAEVQRRHHGWLGFVRAARRCLDDDDSIVA